MTSGMPSSSSASRASRRVSKSQSGSSSPSLISRTCSSVRLACTCVPALILSEAPLHLEFDKAVEFDRVLDRQFLRDRLDEAGDDHLLGVVVVQSTRLEVEDVLVADLADGRLVGDVDFRFLDLHVRHGVAGL